MFWVFCVCVCVVVHVYMRGTAPHILVYFSLLNINQCRRAPCCIGKWNVRVRLPVAKTKHGELWSVCLFVCFPGDNCFMLLVAINAEIVFMSLKNIHRHKESGRKNVQLDWVLLGFSGHTETQRRLEEKRRRWWVLTHMRRVERCLADSQVAGLLPRMKMQVSEIKLSANFQSLNILPTEFPWKVVCQLQCYMELKVRLYHEVVLI